jgi:hypothetical protein
MKLLTRYTQESYPFLHEPPMARFQEHECKGILQCLAWICMQLACNDPEVEQGWFIKQVIWLNKRMMRGRKFITIAPIRHSAPETETLSYQWRERGPPNLGSYSSYSEGLF